MAKAVKEQASYGAFERFIYIFFIPTVFAIILSSVLLSFFGYDVFGTAWRMVNSVPVIGRVIPDPKATPAAPSAAPEGEQTYAAQDAEKVKQMLAQKDSQISQLTDEDKAKDQTIAELQSQIKDLQDQLQQKTASDEEYLDHVKSLAATYAQMNPSKSAPLLDQLTIPELVLVLGQMTQDARVAVLERMDPKIAAEASIQLKDVVTAKDREIAALQARLQEDDKQISNTEKLNNADLAQTFAGMSAASAAAVLDEMLGTNPDKLVAVLTVMDSGPRAQILSAINDISAEDAAKIANLISK